MEEDVSYQVIGCAYKIHSALGAGLYESVYERALMHEFKKMGIKAENQVPIEVIYDGESLGEAYKADIIVNDELIIELKSVEELKPIHFKQLLTYLKLSGKKVGLLINFNEVDLKKGIHRVVNDF